ncbi:MAG TPA: hypothetical protein VFS66_08215 [Acidimicrobiia bacterium]|nr:hypothetical protein [Acidimicrobiia bacterium]
MRRAGFLLIAGGATWLAGSVAAGLAFDSAEDPLPLPVVGLALLGGLLAGWGAASLSTDLISKWARLSVRALSVSAFLLALGMLSYGSGLPDLALTYLLVVVAVGILFFVVPVVFAAAGIGLIGDGSLGRWGGLALLATGLIGAVAYWSPLDITDAFVASPWWFSYPGIGWLILGLASVSDSRADLLMESDV